MNLDSTVPSSCKLSLHCQVKIETAWILPSWAHPPTLGPEKVSRCGDYLLVESIYQHICQCGRICLHTESSSNMGKKEKEYKFHVTATLRCWRIPSANKSKQAPRDKNDLFCRISHMSIKPKLPTLLRRLWIHSSGVKLALMAHCLLSSPYMINFCKN